MNELELKEKFDCFASALMVLSEEFEKLMPELKLQMDKRAVLCETLIYHSKTIF